MRLTDKMREKKMGELFADMEKMDIQAERCNTANAMKRKRKPHTNYRNRL